MKYFWIKIYWQDNDETCSWEGNNLTMEEAKQKAAVWGFKEPKWWQFWQTRPLIYTVL
jgi:hypothetical protein